MNAIRGLLTFLISSLLFAAGLVALWVGWTDRLPLGFAPVPAIRDWSGVLLLAGPAMMGLPLLRLLTAFLSGDRARFVMFNNPAGLVQVSVDAIRDYLSRIEGEFSEVDEIRPRVWSRKDSMVVLLECRVRTGTTLPELSRRLQERVQVSIEQGLGLPPVQKVMIRIREIKGGAPEIEPVSRPDAARSAKSVEAARYGGDGMIVV